MYLASPTTKNVCTIPSSLFGFWRQHVSHLGVLLWSIHQVTRKIAGFEQDPEQEKILQQAQLLCELLCYIDSKILWIQGLGVFAAFESSYK